MSRKKWWYVIGVILIVVIFVFAVFLVSRFGGKEDSSSPRQDKVEDVSKKEDTEKDSVSDIEKDMKETDDIIEIKRDKESKNPIESETEENEDTQPEPADNTDADSSPDNSEMVYELEFGRYEYENGEYISALNVEDNSGIKLCYLGYWSNYGNSPSEEDFYFDWIDGQLEYFVTGNRSGDQHKLTFTLGEDKIHIRVENMAGADYHWDNSDCWSDLDYLKK